RSAIELAFTRTHAPYAAAALRQVTRALDHHAASWIQFHTDACRATRILGDQTEATLDLRMTCLERRRQEAGALVGMLSTADSGAVAGAVAATDELTAGLGACADLAALRQTVPPPSGAVRDKLAELTPQLAAARAAHQLGAYPHALELIRPLAERAHALAYRPFEAEVGLMQGWIEFAMGDPKHAEATLEATVWAAEAGREDEIAAEAWSWLVYLIGYREAEYTRGLALVPRATAAIARLGGNDRLESRLERALGAIDGEMANFESATAHSEKAVALAERAFR